MIVTGYIFFNIIIIKKSMTDLSHDDVLVLLCPREFVMEENVVFFNI